MRANGRIWVPIILIKKEVPEIKEKGQKSPVGNLANKYLGRTMNYIMKQYTQRVSKFYFTLWVPILFHNGWP